MSHLSHLFIPQTLHPGKSQEKQHTQAPSDPSFETYSAFPEHVASISDNGNPVCARKGTHLSDSQPAPPWLVQSCDLHGRGGLNLVPASSPHPGLECTGQVQAHTASSGTSEDGVCWSFRALDHLVLC